MGPRGAGSGEQSQVGLSGVGEGLGMHWASINYSKSGVGEGLGMHCDSIK